MNELINIYDKKRTWLSVIGFILILSVFLTRDIIYPLIIRQTSEYVYTIGVTNDIIAVRGQVGRKIEYQYNQETYKVDCFSRACKRLDVGDRVLVRIYIDGPTTYDLIFDSKVDLAKTPPDNGWKSIDDI